MNHPPIDYVSLFFEKSALWLQSEDRVEFHCRLALAAPPDGWKLARAYCVGTGKIVDPSRDERIREGLDYRTQVLERSGRRLAQLVIFLETARQLETLTGKLIPMFIYESLWTTADYEVLELLGVPVDRRTMNSRHRDFQAETLRADDFCCYPYTPCGAGVFAQAPNRQLVLYFGNGALPLSRARPAQEIGKPQRTFTDLCHNGMLLGERDEWGIRPVLLQAYDRSRTRYVLYQSFFWSRGKSQLGCVRLPLEADNITVYVQERSRDGGEIRRYGRIAECEEVKGMRESLEGKSL